MKMITKIMHLLFLSCLKATELIEKQFHFKLSILERMRLKIHKSMCEACTNYEKQSRVLEVGIQQHIKKGEIQEDVSKLKIEIIQKLETK